MKAKKKRGVEAPPRIRAFINNVIATPIENIEAALAGFTWDYEKGDFYHWIDLLNHFDAFFDKYVKGRSDLQLEGDNFSSDEPFPKDAILQILKVTRIILENCVNKSFYNSTEHLSTLLSSSDPEIVIAALKTLAAFAKRPAQSNRPVRWQGDLSLNARLFSLSQGWGGKEEGLGLVACASEDGCDQDVIRLGATLHFEFYGTQAAEKEEETGTRGLQVLHIPDLHRHTEDDFYLLKKLVDQYRVPVNLRFSLLTRIRFARSFPFLSLRRQYICIRLLALTVLLQSNPEHEDLAAFFVNEPEFINELVTLLHCEDTVPEDIRILAVLALAALSQDRPRQSTVLNVISAGGHRGILPSLMQKAIGSLASGAFGYSVAFVEALLSLVSVLVSSSSGCAALREAGLIPTLIPLLKYTSLPHIHLVTSAVHILEAFMDYSNPAGTLFRDLGGLDDTIIRLDLEVSRIDGIQKNQETLALDKGKAPMVEDVEVAQPVPPASESLIPYQQRLLLKALLRAIALGTYSPGNNARVHGSDEGALPSCLCRIFQHSKVFGGGVFALAASIMSDMLHKDPTCFPSLDKAGLPTAFLDAIASGVLPSSEAIGGIPASLDAICLNNAGLQAVKDRNALSCFVRIFTHRMYSRALANDTPGSLASGLDELMRHQPSLRGPGVDMCIEILNTIAALGGASEVPEAIHEAGTEAPVPMETDGDERQNLVVSAGDRSRPESSQQLVDASDNATALRESLLSDCINNAVRLLETILQNADTSKIFIEKKGIKSLLQLYTLPYLPVSFGGSSTAHNMSVTLRAFPPQHATTLTRDVCAALRHHLQVILETLMLVSGRKVSELEDGLRTKVVKGLSAAECFLSLVSVLVRSSATMMVELSLNNGEVLNGIGKLNREVLWQISLIDDAKVEIKQKDVETTANMPSSSAAPSTARETEDDGENFSVIRYVNPVTLRNGPNSHWAEAEFLPIIHGGGDRLRGRTRREHIATAEALSQIARIGRLARNVGAAQVELESSAGSSTEALLTQDSRRKSPDTINFEMMTRLVTAARGLYVALGKALVVPSRRRDDTVTLSMAAKSVASGLARLFHDNLSFEGYSSVPVSVKCRYFGKVVEDMTAVLFDSRRRTCNTALVNHLYAHGAIKQLLMTFEATSQLVGTIPQSFSSPMETENVKPESGKLDEKADQTSWLFDTLQSYAKLMEHLVTSSLLLTPPSMAQLLVQQVSGGSMHIPRDPESFVRAIQAQVLEVVLPLWNQPFFSKCPSSFISSVAAIITHVYSGVGDVKSSRTNVPGTGSRHRGPPPDEALISTIVEMGFPRSRAEEALRRVETNSVEMAMEWLFNHPEEVVQEDDELARALALSLGSSEASKETDISEKSKDSFPEDEKPKLPPLEEMLGVCMNLLQNTDAVAFPLMDLLVTICNRNKGEDRARVVLYLIEQLKLCSVEQTSTCPLSTISHILALVLNEDTAGREVAAENGLVNVALNLLVGFTSEKTSEESGCVDVPKWVTVLLLILDHMLQYKPKINLDAAPVSGASAPTNNGGSSANQSSEQNIFQDKDGNPFISILGKTGGYMTDEEQKRAMSVACSLLHMQLPATAVQAVLQLCAHLTKTHSISMQFLESGGLSALLALPRSSLFPGFDSVANAIIRHLLEDPQTLLQAMESEIRHTLTAASSRHNGRVSPRIFLTALAPVLSRDPAVFMQAAANVCQIEANAGRYLIVLAKEKDKDREKDKLQEKDKDKAKTGASAHNEERPVAEGYTKQHEQGGKPAKFHKKVPHSFSQVIDQLLEVILHYPPPLKEEHLVIKDGSPSSATAMEVDELVPRDKGKGKVHEKKEVFNVADSVAAATAKVTFILKLMTEFLMMYSSAVSVVLRRDFESSQGRVPGYEVGHGGLLYHVLHRLLPHTAEKTSDKHEDEWREKLADKAAYFLIAVCVRSGEGRRRVVQEIARALGAAAVVSDTTPKGVIAPDRKVRAFVDLVNSVLSSHSSAGSAQTPGISSDMSKTMIESGMVLALTQTLEVIDLDHPDAPKLVNAILKALEALTRAVTVGEHGHGSDAINQKKVASGERSGHQRLSESNEAAVPAQGVIDNAQSHDELMGDTIQEAQAGVVTTVVQIEGDNSRDQMEHDMHPEREMPDVSLEVEAEEAFMREAAEDAVVLEGATAEMTFRMEHVGGGDGDDDDDEEDMDGDDGEDDEEEEEEDEDEDEDDIEGDGVPHLSPPDTDVEDHDNGLNDDYEEDMVDEEEDDEDWHGDRVIEVRWRDGLTGLSHVQLLGTGGGNLVDFPGDPFQAMNMDDVFGSFRRSATERRPRLSSYRPAFPEPPGGIRGAAGAGGSGGAFHHPLLTRTPAGAGSTGGTTSSWWASTGNAVREAEAMLGSGLDVTHLYMYDGPMLNAGDDLFGERGVGGPPPPLIDFSMDPIYLMRRNGRADGRFSSWTDDGQPQPGAHAAAVAQAIEEQFVSQLRGLVPSEQAALDTLPSIAAENPEQRQMDAEGSAVGHEHNQAQSMEANLDSLEHDGQRLHASVPADASLVDSGLVNPGQADIPSGSSDLDVQMQEERSEPAADAEAFSQDSGGSGATVGESLRSLEVEIGSADGRDEQAGSERLIVGEVPQASLRVLDGSRLQDGDGDEDMDSVPVAVRPNEPIASAPLDASLSQDESGGAAQEQGIVEGRSEMEAGLREGGASGSSIDPTFLEALPEDLRAEVLASQQTQSARTATEPPPPAEDIDPEFLAALPLDIQAEVLAQQRAQRMIQAHHVEGQPVDMDSASIIATFPAELREEVLLTSSEAVLAALPPALLAEAQLLRERAMNQFQTRGLFGGRATRRNTTVASGGGPAAIDRGVGGDAGFAVVRRAGLPPSGPKFKEVEGKPLVDAAAVKAILRLIRLAQPLGKGLLQRLLLNLCGHSATRVMLVRLLLDMLRPETERVSSDEYAASQRLFGCQWNVVYARPQVSDGVPPLVSRRVLEILTYLARNQYLVANLLLYLEPGSATETPGVAAKDKGKEKVSEDVPVDGIDSKKGEVPLILLLKLLNRPLYSRSSAHLEQVMGLLDVVIGNAGLKSDFHIRFFPPSGIARSSGIVPDNRDEIGAITGSGNEVGPTAEPMDSGGADLESEPPAPAPSQAGSDAQPSDAQPSEQNADDVNKTADVAESSGVSQNKIDAATILLSLPETELRNLCHLLAREGLSDMAYSRVAEVLKKLAAAAPPHRQLFVVELADAARSLSGPAIEELHCLADKETVVLSASSLAGAALLRVLQALSVLTSVTEAEKARDVESTMEKEQEEGMAVIRALNSALEPLWLELSTCVGKMESRLHSNSVLSSPSSSAVVAAAAAGGVAPPLPPGTQKVLPFVEAFFVLCEKLRSGPAPSVQPEPVSATACETKEAASSSEFVGGISPKPSIQQKRIEERGMTFLRFADRHRRLLNAFVRQNPGLLEKSLSLMLKSPRLIDFDNKRAYFRSRIRQQHEQQHFAPLRICVRRAYVLEDSYNQLRMRNADELKGRLTVQFQGEEGIDAGGLTREWYQLLSRVIFDKGALLFTTVGNESTFQPNPNSVYQTEHLSYFKFVGRVVAKALFDGQLLDVYFTRSFYKHILGSKVTYHDIEAVDPDYFKSLKWMLENDVNDSLELTFSIDADEEKHILYEKSEVTDYELIPGGRNIRVTAENKHEYVDLVAEHRLTTAIRPQINSFLEGFNELVSRELIGIFNDKELELLISGLPEIDIEDLKANTEYTGYTAASPVVQWFWDVVQGFNKEDMARLLQFITGTSKVPLEGFRALQGISGPQRFQIHKAYGAPERLPSAHTCFNQLDLPEYSSKEQLQERLLLAIHEASEGFGFG